MIEFVVPHLGEGIDKVKIALWHVKAKDKININDDIVEVTTDKASFNVNSEYNGIVEKILFDEETEVSVGDTVAYIKNEE